MTARFLFSKKKLSCKLFSDSFVMDHLFIRSVSSKSNNIRIFKVPISRQTYKCRYQNCKLSSSEISFSFFARSVFYFEQIIWSTSFRSLILHLLTPTEAPSNSSFFTLIQTLILKNSQPEPTDFFWLMTLFNIYSAKEF